MCDMFDEVTDFENFGFIKTQKLCRTKHFVFKKSHSVYVQGYNMAKNSFLVQVNFKILITSFINSAINSVFITSFELINKTPAFDVQLQYKISKQT